MRCIFTNRTIGIGYFSIGTNGPLELPCTQLDHIRKFNNLSPLNEMHIHQQNHWNDILFYWYQSYHWYQWTISLTNRIRLGILEIVNGKKKLKKKTAVLTLKPRSLGVMLEF